MVKMTEEGFVRLMEAVMAQAYDDASYEGDNAKRLAEKADAEAFIERMKSDFATA